MRFLVIFSLVSFIGYLVGSFIAATFDITKWDLLLRLMIGIFSPFIAAMTTVTILHD